MCLHLERTKRLKKLKLMILETRKKREDLIQFCKILNCLDNNERKSSSGKVVQVGKAEVEFVFRKKFTTSKRTYNELDGTEYFGS